jgi:hypothetical protein
VARLEVAATQVRDAIQITGHSHRRKVTPD